MDDFINDLQAAGERATRGINMGWDGSYRSPSRNRARRFGDLSSDEKRAMLEKQGGGCAVCDRKSGPFVIDHEWPSGEERGVLCRHCNSAIGMMKDNPELLRKAAAYIEGA